MYMYVRVCKHLVGICWTGKNLNLLKGPGITQYLKKVGGVKRSVSIATSLSCHW